MNLFNIERSFRDRNKKGWPKLFWAIDLHDTVITGKYNKFNEGSEIYPGVKEVFAWFKRRPDMVPILYTSSHADAVMKTCHWLREQGIEFAYINENPEVPSNELCDFSKKLYFNILLDDKAGFVGESDWIRIRGELLRIGQWSV